MDARQTRQLDFERLEQLHFESPGATRPEESSRSQVVPSEPKSSSPSLGAEHPAISYLEEQILTGRSEAEGGRPEQKAERPEV